MKEIFSNYTATISDLQSNPRSIWEHDEPVAIFDHNQPIGYCIPQELYLQIMNALEDAHWARIIEERKNDREVEVAWNDL
ncbi:MAG: plasmid stabilization protein [Pseudomonadota bacterium]